MRAIGTSAVSGRKNQRSTGQKTLPLVCIVSLAKTKQMIAHCLMSHLIFVAMSAIILKQNLVTLEMLMWLDFIGTNTLETRIVVRTSRVVDFTSGNCARNARRSGWM